MGRKVESERRPVAVDLFCGAGGMSLGFEQAGFDVMLGVDLDGYHCATHERNFPYGKTLCRSVASLTRDEIFAALEGQKEVDVVFGGPPCQGFSNMGLRDALDPRNTLVAQFARIVGEVRPKTFVMENVPGMLAGATRAVLDDAVARFESYGYRVVHPVRVLDASLFGVPQKRRRLIVMGIREDLPGTLEYPDGPPDSFPDRPTVWEAIGDLPDVDADEELFALNNARYTKKPASDYAKLMRGAMLDPADFSYPRNWDGSHCTGCLRVRHTPSAIALYTATRAGDMVPGHKLPRLDPAGIAPTLRAGSDSTHGSYTAPRPIHPHRPRCITAREAARLHGYPDWFDFYPLKWHAYRQIGNSVCPPVARALGMSLMKALELEPTRPTKTLVMNDEYRLPPERPRSLKRIPQVLHFPPVIAHLFADRFNDERQTLTNGKFTFEEVKRAVGETGVQLTWIRPDTFLSEISRSRNVRKLLDPCLRRGYTIRKCNDKKYIGEFVPVGHEEGIEVKAKADRSSSISRRRKDVARGQKPLFT